MLYNVRKEEDVSKFETLLFKTLALTDWLILTNCVTKYSFEKNVCALLPLPGHPPLPLLPVGFSPVTFEWSNGA